MPADRMVIGLLVATALRVTESYRPEGERLFEDRFGRDFLPPVWRLLLLPGVRHALIVIILNIWTPLGMLILAGLDVRFGWSPEIPLALQVTTLVLAVLGYLVSVWAAASNKFYGRFVRIQKERGHTVVTGGPYQYVRHPGYAGLIIFYFAAALALGSLWTLMLNGLASLLLVVRTALEDKTLLKELDGYREYAGRVRYRLLPGIW
jgi:protein-S-isoprenylcysteine O-methyltransferase Ste14